MNDIIQLNNNLNLELTQDYFNINLALSIPEFATIASQPNKDKAKLELAYVALSSSYKSDLIMKGLSDKELHNAICTRLSLPVDFEVTPEIKNAIDEYKKHYNYGVFGTIAELYKSFEITRNSIAIINNILYKTQESVKNKLKGDLTIEETSTLVGNAKEIIGYVTSIQSIASNLDKSINDLKIISEKVVAVENKEQRAYGGGKVPKTARRTN